MAEYYISYSNLNNYLSEIIKKEKDIDKQQILNQNRISILAALTGDFEGVNSDGVRDLVSLWQNLILEPSQLVICRKYIQIQSVLCSFLETAITSGALEAMIVFFTDPGNINFSITTSFSVAWGIWKLFSSIKELNDRDFCVYKQATKHFREYSEFTITELKSWFPHGTPPICNMHNNTWECDYINEDDTCSILCGNNLNDAIDSLLFKRLLDTVNIDGQERYKFKW